MKSNHLFTLGLVGAAAALVIFTVFFESKKEAPLDTKDVQVWSLTENQAKDLTMLVFTSGADSATYVRKGENWILEKEPKRDLTPGAWVTAYNNFKTLMATRKVEDKAADLAKYGLAKPSASVRWGDEKSPYRLGIGEKSPTGDAYYVHAAKDDAVYTVASWKVDEWKTLANKPPLEPLATPSPVPTAATPGVPGAQATPTPDPNARKDRPARPTRPERTARPDRTTKPAH